MAELDSENQSAVSTGMKLVVSRGAGRGKVFVLEEGNNLIGRWDPEDAAFPEVDLEAEDEDAKVSRKHAIIICRDGQAILEDIGSLNGTFVNQGQRLQPGSPYVLKNGDEVIVGKTALRFECDEEEI